MKSYEELQKENESLCAQIAVLESYAAALRFKGGILSNVCYNIGQQHDDAEQILQVVREYDSASRAYFDVMSFGPVRSLQEIKAVAVEEFSERVFSGNDYLHFNLKTYATQYADEIRKGGVE